MKKKVNCDESRTWYVSLHMEACYQHSFRYVKAEPGKVRKTSVTDRHSDRQNDSVTDCKPMVPSGFTGEGLKTLSRKLVWQTEWQPEWQSDRQTYCKPIVPPPGFTGEGLKTLLYDNLGTSTCTCITKLPIYMSMTKRLDFVFTRRLAINSFSLELKQQM